jgi:hypothetical protein
MTTDPVALGFPALVLAMATIALMLKLMIFALALDDWFEMRDTPKSHPERMVADDEVVASAARVVSVVIVVIIASVWVLTVLMGLPVILIRATFGLGILALAFLALFNGMRSMLFRRAMARVLNRSRRPVGLSSVDHQPTDLHAADHIEMQEHLEEVAEAKSHDH